MDPMKLTDSDCDTEEFRNALKLVIKCEIQSLLQRLAKTGEESMVITASMNDGRLSHFFSSRALKFATSNEMDDIKKRFWQSCTGEENIAERRNMPTTSFNQVAVKQEVVDNEGYAAQVFMDGHHSFNEDYQERITDGSLTKKIESAFNFDEKLIKKSTSSVVPCQLFAVNSGVPLNDQIFRNLSNQGNNSSLPIDKAMSRQENIVIQHRGKRDEMPEGFNIIDKSFCSYNDCVNQNTNTYLKERSKQANNKNSHPTVSNKNNLTSNSTEEDRSYLLVSNKTEKAVSFKTDPSVEEDKKEQSSFSITDLRTGTDLYSQGYASPRKSLQKSNSENFALSRMQIHKGPESDRDGANFNCNTSGTESNLTGIILGKKDPSDLQNMELSEIPSVPIEIKDECSQDVSTFDTLMTCVQGSRESSNMIGQNMEVVEMSILPTEMSLLPTPDQSLKEKSFTQIGGMIKCLLCNKILQSKNYMDTHWRIHIGLRPFECSVCGRQFSDLSNKRRHMKLHTGIKPHKCYVCGQTFNRRDSMASHFERKHQAFLQK
ncbi:hypothetical protein ACJMK2_024640 [Sinanodonta woodiana]|uniref:C2H2-type domain-containing protein n=1 Tax=Sinanodonta woodiana TaxID=1069815 RepID=A0ABD3XFH9_SINWO